MFYLNRLIRSLDLKTNLLSALNTNIKNESNSELTNYFNNSINNNFLNSSSSNSSFNSLSNTTLSSLSSINSSSLSVYLVYQLTTVVNNLAIDTGDNNSTYLTNFNSNNSLNYSQFCSNNNSTECIEYEKNETIRQIEEEFLYPSTLYEFVLIALHVIVFIVGLIGNALVCISVYRNHSMRNIVNYFIVNLAVADFLIILICLPPTVLWDVTKTWWFGNTMCKIVYYFQGVSVFVSILTLTFISIDRWYAICHPLRFKCTTAKARIVICLIWLTSLIAMLPESMSFYTSQPDEIQILNVPYFTDCKSSWEPETQQIYQIFFVLCLFIIPFILMSLAYYQIAKVLWVRHIPGSAERSSPTANSESRRSSSQINRSFSNYDSNKNLCVTFFCYLCGFKYCFSKNRTDRHFNNNINNNNRNMINRQITELISQPQSPTTSFSQNNKMSFELNGCLKTNRNINNNSCSNNNCSLQCTPLDTPTGTQSPTLRNNNDLLNENISPQSKIETATNRVNDLVNLETIIEANFASTLSIDGLNNNNNDNKNKNRNLKYSKEDVNVDQNNVEFLNKNMNQQNEINLNDLSTNIMNNLNNMSTSNEHNSEKINTNISSKNFLQTALSKLSRCKALILRAFRLDSSNRNQSNGVSLAADNYDRQDTNKTELTTLSNGQIQFRNPSQTTSFIRSRSTRPRTIDDKTNRLSTPLQTLNSNQGNFRRLRRMTLANPSEMLIAVVVMFGICYLPVHLLNILRTVFNVVPQNTFTTVASLLSHWLCYANSALNPIIYNVMSGKFRREFKNAFTCMCFRTQQQQQSTICRNSQHQATKILNRQPASNRIRVNPQLIEVINQSFTNNNTGDVGSYLLNNSTSIRTTQQHSINKQNSQILNNNENSLISQVEMPAS